MDDTYPQPYYPDITLRMRWRLPLDDQHIFQVNEENVDRHIQTIAIYCYDLSRRPGRNPHIKYPTFIIDNAFISFHCDVIEFIKLHQMEIIVPMLKEAILLSLRRNSKHVEMSDLQPFLATRYKVWTLGTSVDYFTQKRTPQPRTHVHTRKCVSAVIPGNLRKKEKN